MTNFDGLNLIEPLLRNVEAAGFSAPTEIQAATIPALLEGRDLMGISHTGGGKTAAFCLPLLQRLAENPQRPKPGQPRAVILAPTRELATQIGQCLRDFKKRHPPVFFCCLWWLPDGPADSGTAPWR